MLKDYSGSYLYVTGRNKIRSPRKKSFAAPKGLLTAAKLMRKSIGVMLLATLVLGISSAIWYGLKVQIALDQIGSSRTVNNELLNENKLLTAQRDLLLTRQHMEEAAFKLGLGFPSQNQIRYP